MDDLELVPDDSLEVDMDDGLLDMDCSKSGDGGDQKSSDDAADKKSSSKDKDKEKSQHNGSKSEKSGREEPAPDDFDDVELDSEEEPAGENSTDAEEDEKEFLNMPQFRTVIKDVGHLKQDRRIMVHPLTMKELRHPKLEETVNKDTCEEIRLHFVRPSARPNDWSGILMMHFSSTAAAKAAVDDLQTIRSDIEVKSTESSDSSDSVNLVRSMEQWARDEKGQKRWTDTLLVIKNISENVTEDQLKELFSDAEDIVLHKDDRKPREGEEVTKMAYAVYRTQEAAKVAANEYADKIIETDGRRLKIFKYHIPLSGGERDLLKLRERRLVMKYMTVLETTISKGDADTDFKVPTWCSKRMAACKRAIERDDAVRKSAGLATPTLDELRELKVKVVKGTDRRDTLTRLNIIDRPRRPYRREDNRRSSYRSDSSRGSSGMPRNSLLGNPPSLISLTPHVVPLQLMMQQNIGFMNNMMAQSRQLGMMGMPGLLGPGSLRNMGGSSSLMPPQKMLRLDETGTFHLDYNKHKRPSDTSRSKPSSSASSSKGRDSKGPVSLLDL